MFAIPLHDLQHLLTTYGYWVVFVFIAIESMGIPFPGETMLLVAAIYTGTTHHLSILLVILAAAGGAILGDNLGFILGHVGGYRLLRRYGHSIRLDERKLKLGQYLFMKHGGKVVFFGRFVAVLRAWAAFLAGTNQMRWSSFLLFNALGGITWATLFGLGGYFLGDNVHRLTGPVAISSMVLAPLLIIAFLIFLHQNEQRLEAEAERALPGPLDVYQPKASQEQILRRHVPLTLSTQEETAFIQSSENKRPIAGQKTR
ncbi:MAG: hypothetical protein NVSMB38_39530 [Ktedonobacteraceae bacterium]